MSRENYSINVNGTLTSVTEEQYLVYYRAKRRMRYFEHDIKTETPIRDNTGNIIDYAPSKEDSLERLYALGLDFADAQESIEDITIRTLMSDKLHEALDKLSNSERELINALFFTNNGVGMGERECATMFGISKTALHARKLKVLKKLRELLENNLQNQ